jgi:peptide/histidine transporter 3/4
MNYVFNTFFQHSFLRNYNLKKKKRIQKLSLSRAIGVGAVQANMAVFGAEQVREQKSKTRYFDVYYAAINTGGLIAFGAIAFLQLKKDYFIGYLVPGGLLILAFVLFVIGYKYYIHIKPHDSVITVFFPVLINAFQSWRNYRRNRRETIHGDELRQDETIVETEGDSNVYLSFTINTSTWSFLDYAKISNQGRFLDRIVNDIKSLRRIIVVFLLLIPYWLLYVQVSSTLFS